MMKARDFAGHTDIKTTMSRYDHSDRNVDDLFKKTKLILRTKYAHVI